MAEPLKNLYTPELLQKLTDLLQKQYKTFDKKKFSQTVFDKEWPNRELKQRMRHITNCIHQFLPMSYAKQMEILSPIAHHFTGFVAILFPDFVEVYGVDEPDISIPALEQFTQYSSSEFAVRPFIIKYEKRMVKQHLQWATHKNHHVRRLASEGIRPRLPWAMALPSFKKDPSAILPILELLKADESEYVRRSVANCLNDISKDHADSVLKIVNNWKGISPETDRIIKHASRGLLKQGHTEALSSFGLNYKVKVDVDALSISKKKLPIGGRFDYSFSVTLTEKKPHDVRLEYKIYYQKANGKQNPKVFQIGTYAMQHKQTLTINRSHAFADLTTRKHHKGDHRIVVVVNGKETAELAFILQ
ncbi:MAG: DNA alkylation repair protein [Bacteroidota bacterium]